MEEQKNGEGKGGKYLEKGNIWSREDRKNGESIWRRKIFGRRTLKPKNPKILSARLSRAELSVVKGKFYIKSKST